MSQNGNDNGGGSDCDDMNVLTDQHAELDADSDCGSDDELQHVMCLDQDGGMSDISNMAYEETVSDMTRMTITAHQGSVFTCCVVHNGRVAVTGGEDDTFAVWHLPPADYAHSDVDISRPLKAYPLLARVTQGASDSVTHTVMSDNCRRLAVGDLAGGIRVYDLPANSPQGEGAVMFRLVCSMHTGSDLNWLLWHPGAATNIVLCGTAAGDVWMWRIAGKPPAIECPPLADCWTPPGDHGEYATTQCRMLPGCGSSCTVGVLVSQPSLGACLRLAVGHGDGSVRLVHLRSGATLGRCVAGSSDGHVAAVTCMHVRADGQLMASAGLDGSVRLMSVTDDRTAASTNMQACQLRHVGTLACRAIGRTVGASGSNSGSEDDGVEQVMFCHDHSSLLASVTTSGQLSVWDVASRRVRYRVDTGAGGSRLCWWNAPHGAPHVLVGCLDGSAVQVDARTGSVVRRFTSTSRCHVLDMCVSADGSTLLAAMDDGKLCVFNLNAAKI